MNTPESHDMVSQGTIVEFMHNESGGGKILRTLPERRHVGQDKGMSRKSGGLS